MFSSVLFYHTAFSLLCLQEIVENKGVFIFSVIHVNNCDRIFHKSVYSAVRPLEKKQLAVYGKALKFQSINIGPLIGRHNSAIIK
jgi:hypothetical protein